MNRHGLFRTELEEADDEAELLHVSEHLSVRSLRRRLGLGLGPLRLGRAARVEVHDAHALDGLVRARADGLQMGEEEER